MRFILWLSVLILVGYSLGAILTQLILLMDPDQSGFLLDRGPGKLMRRITMIVVIVGLPLLLRKTSWQGWRDNGLLYQGMAPASPAKEFGLGFLIGLVTLHALMFIAFMGEDRYWSSEYRGGALVVAWIGIVFRAVFVGIGEEVVARGVFFRSIARMWRVWPAAIFTSLIFALGHFLKPQDHAFGGDFGFRWVLSPMQSMVEYMSGLPLIELRVLNMTLMSMVLCLIVYRRKTIWLAAGLHGGWIMAKGMNSKLFSFDHDNVVGWWAGARSDFTDSIMCTIMLTSLMIIVLAMKNRSGSAPGDDKDTFYKLDSDFS